MAKKKKIEEEIEEVVEVTEEALDKKEPVADAPGTVGPADFADTMGTNYMIYAKSVLVDRALPSIDGLKPVQRRILLAMNDLRLRPDSRYSKCAKVVGTTLGSYHPHGDASVYGALVNMAQDFTMRLPLIDGHGSFGSIDGDGAAAMRYTEARLAGAAMELLLDLDPEILPDHYGRNFDESMLEPEILPARFPNILINGGTGIGVGMATTILPHNPEEVVDLCIWRAKNEKAKAEELVQRLSGPDFPTGASVLNDEGLLSSYLTGKGKVTAVAKAHIEEVSGNKEKIVITEIPWSVNKGDLLSRIAKQHADGKFPEIVELNDLSRGDHDIRIEATLKWGANARGVLQRLLRHTGLRKVYGVEMNVLIEGRPETLGLTEIIDHFLAFRREVIRNRAKKRIAEILERLHKLEAYTKVVDHTDEVVQIIKKAKDRAAAKPPLKKLLKVDDQQAQWIVEMQLGQLTQLDRSKLLDEVKTLENELKGLEELIRSKEKITGVMVDEFSDLKAVWKKNGWTERSTDIILPSDGEDDLLTTAVPSEDCNLLISRAGRAMCAQGTLRRGGQLNLEKEDPVVVASEANTDQEWLIFAASGKAYKLRLADLPLEGGRVKGAVLSDIIGLETSDKIVAALRAGEKKGEYVFVSRRGVVKRTRAKELSSVHTGGVLVSKPGADDELAFVFYLSEGKEGDLVLIGSHGKVIRFPLSAIRSMGRTAGGVRGMRLPDDASVIGSLLALPETEELLLAATGGFAKRVPLEQISAQNRGGGGLLLMKVGGKYGEPAFAAAVEKEQELWVDMGAGRLKPQPMKKVPLGKRATMPKRWPGEKAIGIFSLPVDGRG
jgi:DNA gyrase subunit A